MQTHRDSLSAEQLQLFAAGLSGLSRDEIRKAKSLYLRNEISEYKASRASMDGFQKMQGCFMVIPIFWPFVWGQRQMIKTAMSLYAEKIRNALAVWRDDLGDEVKELERLLQEVEEGDLVSRSR